jgi:DNA polymerase-3 subunit gamma/tau
MDLIEIDAASNRGIDDIRDLRERIAFHPGEGQYKLYIIDEAHELTTQAWDALLKTLEEPPPHAIFVLATTEAHKVPATIVSRCQRFDLRRIPFDLTREHLVRVAQGEGLTVDGAVLERLALVARGGLRDALSLLDQLGAFAGGQIDMTVARAALSLPSIEAVRGVIAGLGERDPAAVMAVVADVAEGGGDVRLLVEELVVHLRALLLLRSGADARLTDELPPDEVTWLRERAPSWSIGTLMRLLHEFSNALARTRDAQQFQVQTEVALLQACDVEALAPAAIRIEPAPRPIQPAPIEPTSPPRRSAEEISPLGAASAAAAATSTAGAPSPITGSAEGAAMPAPVAEPLPASPPPRSAEESSPLGVASAAAAASSTPRESEAVGASAESLQQRWPDVIDHVKSKKPILAALLSSAHPEHLDGNVLTVAFSTDFNRKRAELAANRQTIEDGLQHALGRALRLKCTVQTESNGGEPSLLDDPVINFAQRTFGGQPRRVPE